MQEDRRIQSVRKAVEITNELVPHATTPESAYSQLWSLVFSHLVYVPYDPLFNDNLTATGAKIASEQSN